MKILRIISRLNIGGPSIHVKILQEGFNNRRFGSQLVIGRFSPHEGSMEYLLKVNGRNVHKISTLQREISPIKDMLTLVGIIRIILKTRPDIVHTHMAKAGAIGRCAAIVCNLVFGCKIKLIHTFHGHVLEGYFGKAKSGIFCLIERILALFTHRIIAISHTQKWELSRKFKIASKNKIDIINLGFDLTPFDRANVNKGQFRKKMNIDEDTLLIGIVGRLVPIKNHRLFLRAARRFVDRNPDTPAHFAIIGDGELRPELEQHALDLGMQDKIYFHSWENNIPMVYADLDILALTSDNEGTPVSLIEAMAARVPIITTGVGGVKDLLGGVEAHPGGANGYWICERGIFCPKGDADAFTNGLEYLSRQIASGPGDATLAKANAYVFDNYSDKRLVDNIRTLYETLLN